MTTAPAAVAHTCAATICSAVQQEYPNSLRHTMSSPDDRPLPQQGIKAVGWAAAVTPLADRLAELMTQ